MTKMPALLLTAFTCLFAFGTEVAGQAAGPPEEVLVKSGALSLRALLWRPPGKGPFPAVMFSHGSYSTGDPLNPHDAAALGPVFARHGYVFLFLCRQGVGLSAGQGTAGGDLMARALALEGEAGRNRVQLQLLETEELNEALAGLSFLRALPEVDVHRVAVAGHSFGGSLTLLLAERDTTLRAAVVFGAAAGSWDQSPELRTRLLAAVSRTNAPVLFIHAANDYSIAPGKALAAEMQRLRKPHGLRIYPPVGRNTREGHNLVFGRAATWEFDVFAFLDQHLRR
jgi:carboxymethylenebutenolidase